MALARWSDLRPQSSYDKFIEQLNHVSPRYGDNLHLLSYDEMQPPALDPET